MRVVLLLCFGSLMFFLMNALSGAIWGRGFGMVILVPLLSNDSEFMAEVGRRLGQPADLLVGFGAIGAAGLGTYPCGWLLYRRED
ncbi:MAG: hypothetical protein ACTHMJ_08085 [Thermomicrobiales bacterium]